jgi:hypothetical protein
MREDLTGERNTLFRSRLHKSPGGGQRHTPAPGTGRGRAPAARVAPAKARDRENESNGTRNRLTLVPTLPMNKAGRAPRMGLGFLFDSTMGYPGEGPSHSPNTRRGFRPSRCLWSSKRSSTTLVEHNPSSLDVPRRPPPSKTAHGNSDTSLGRWLHAARTSKSRRDYIGEPSSGLRGTSHRQKPTSKLTPSSEFYHKAITTDMGGVGPHSGASSRPAPDSSTPDPQTRPVVRAAQLMQPQIPPPNDAVVAPSSSIRREFIAKFAAIHGVSQSSLEAIWRSNKHAYNRAHDAPFERFQTFFQETKPHTSFAPENILPGDFVSFL